MQSFADLDAWKIGMELMKEVYGLTKRLPKEELYGITSQLRRAAVSILANLAEGFSRSTSADKAHKYTIARGESAEVEALLLIIVELSYVQIQDVTKALELSHHTGKLLSGLIRTFSSSSPSLAPAPAPAQ